MRATVLGGVGTREVIGGVRKSWEVLVVLGGDMVCFEEGGAYK